MVRQPTLHGTGSDGITSNRAKRRVCQVTVCVRDLRVRRARGPGGGLRGLTVRQRPTMLDKLSCGRIAAVLARQITDKVRKPAKLTTRSVSY
jgi:hypothetical protein